MKILKQKSFICNDKSKYKIDYTIKNVDGVIKLSISGLECELEVNDDDFFSDLMFHVDEEFYNNYEIDFDNDKMFDDKYELISDILCSIIEIGEDFIWMVDNIYSSKENLNRVQGFINNTL